MIKSITDYLDITCNKYPEKISFAENENVFITYKDFTVFFYALFSYIAVLGHG